MRLFERPPLDFGRSLMAWGVVLAHLLHARNRAVWDLADLLPLTGDVQDHHVTMLGGIRAHADVSRSPILVPNGEHDFRVGGASLERVT